MVEQSETSTTLKSVMAATSTDKIYIMSDRQLKLQNLLKIPLN